MATDQTSVSETVDIPGRTPGEVFAHLTDPANHVSSGDHPGIVGPVGTDQLTGKGDRFGMRMKAYGIPYRITNTVVEFDQDRRIAWRHMGGHRWRYELQALDDGAGTRVTETFDLSPVPSLAHPVYRSLFGFPDDYRDNLRGSLDDLRDRLAT